MSLYSNGIAPKQLAQLVDDTEAAQSQAALMAQALENYNALYGKLNALKTKFSGESVLITNDTGIAPDGSTRASGLFVPRTAYGQNRYCLTNGLTSYNANSTTKQWNVNANAAIQYYDYNTGVTTSGTMFVSSFIPYGSVIGTDEGMYVMGGEPSSGGNATAACYRYLISTNAVSAIPSLPAARGRAAVAVQADGAFLVLGGLTNSTANAANSTNTIYRYTPANNTMETVAATLPFRCWNAKTTRRADGTIVIVAAAGSASDDGVNLTTTARAALFNPANGTCVALDSGGGYGALAVLADGRALALVSPSMGKALNPQAAPGSQWTDYPLTVPTGATQIWLPTGSFFPAVKGEYAAVVLYFNSYLASTLFWTGNTPSNAGSSFYVSVN